MVHRGFLRSWRAGGFNDRIISHVRAIIADDDLDVRKMRLLITGVTQAILHGAPSGSRPQLVHACWSMHERAWLTSAPSVVHA